MPQLMFVFERKTAKPHRVYPVDAIQVLALVDAEGKPLYVRTVDECDKQEAPKEKKEPKK